MKFWKRKIRPTGHTIDMTRPTWGHNLSLSSIDKTIMQFSIWVHTRPKVGDDIIWDSSRGIVRGQVIEVTPAPSVWDMSFIKVGDIRLDG